MSLEPVQQFKSFLEKSKEVLILIPENPTGDAIGSAWALYFFLEQKNISPAIAMPNGFLQKFSFLPRPENIVKQISSSRDFVLSFDTTQNKITAIRSEEKANNFKVFITPENGAIDPKNFSFILAKFKYDLLIVLDCPDLEKLGKVYTENTELFFEVPVVNIDHQSDNENFGQINLVDVVASSVSEILAGVLENVDYQSVNQKIAGCLLAGIISATDSFQKKNTTPRALLTAATLMDKGADQQEIVRWLYKTQPLPVLKLWGRAMAKINSDEKAGLIWTALNVSDFVQSRTTPENIPEILEKLEENYIEGKIFMLLYNDTPTSTIADIKFTDLALMPRLAANLNGEIKKGILEIKIPESNLEIVGETLAKKIKEMGM
jgi:nanoRNase/pAp phosphatase (c-di-AMP/oligoRNAs hydrolase)